MTNTLAPELEHKPDDVINARRDAIVSGKNVDDLLSLAEARWEAGWADDALEILESIAASAPGGSRTRQLREAILNERAAFQSYLNHGLAARGISSHVVARARDIWEWLNASFTHLPLPSAGPRAHGGVDLTWRTEGWIVEIELLTGDEEAESGWWMSGPTLTKSRAGALDEREPLRLAFAEFLGSVRRHGS